MIDTQNVTAAIRRLRPGSQFSVYFEDPTKEQTVFNIEYVDDGDGGIDPREIEESIPAIAPSAARYGEVWVEFHDDTPPPSVAEVDAAVAAGPSVVEIRERALVEIRAQRSPMLDALSGIAGRASRRGDNVTARAADDAYDALLDITALPAFLAAQTYDAMKAAILARYYEIAEKAPAAVQAVFREVFG